MRTILILTLIFCGSTCLLAQDTLYRVDGTKQIVKILEVNQSVIKYKSFSDPEGATHVLSIEEVIKINYESGSTAMFYKGATDPIVPEKVSPKRVPKTLNPVPQKTTRQYDIGRNFASVNVLHLMVGSLTIGYEHILKSGNNSFKIPVSIGLQSGRLPDTLSNYFRFKKFSVGMDYYKYSHGKKKTKYFFGPSAEFGQFNYLNYTGILIPPDNLNELKENVSYYIILFQNGFLFHPSYHFDISITAGIGYFHAGSKDYIDEYGTAIVLKGGLNLGYNF